VELVGPLLRSSPEAHRQSRAAAHAAIVRRSINSWQNKRRQTVLGDSVLSRKSLRTAGLLLLSVLQIACFCQSCVWWPPPTSADITAADLAGEYTYEYEGQTVTVYLNDNSTFEIVGSPTLSGSGVWDVGAGAEIVLRYEKPSPGIATLGWYVTGWRGAFSIIGGEGDPDLWNGFVRVR
jgi:hypothetical protein